MKIKQKLLIASMVMVPILGTSGLALASTSGAATAPGATATTVETHGTEAPDSSATSAEKSATTEADGPGGHQDAAGSNVDQQFNGQQ